MFFNLVTLIFWFELLKSSAENSGHDMSHMKIDKDTVITRNMKPYVKKRDNTKHNHDKTDPDWSYSPFPAQVSSHVDQFKRNMTECLKEVQQNDKRTVKRLSPRIDSPVHGECLIACVLKRNGVIDNGKIHKDNLIALVNKFFSKDVKMVKNLEKSLDRCIAVSSSHKDECVMAATLNDCTNYLMANKKH